MYQPNKSPRTKEEIVNRILSYDFDGDLRHLGPDIEIERASAQSFYLHCRDINRTYEVIIRIPKQLH